MILTNKQSLTMILTYAKDNIRWGKVQSMRAEDLVVDGLNILLTSQNLPTLENRNAAAKKFIQAYKLGSALGTFLAGVVYKYGFGIKAPRLQLGEALIVVATQGYENPLALYFMGINLLHANNLHGIEYLEAAAKSEIKQASLTLALVYLFRQDLVPTSYITAIGHLQNAGLFGQGLLAKVQEHIANLQQQRFAVQEPRAQLNYRPMPLLVLR